MRKVRPGWSSRGAYFYKGRPLFEPLSKKTLRSTSPDLGRIAALDTLEGLKNMLPRKDVLELTITGVPVERAEKRISELPFVHSCTTKDETLRVSKGT